MGLHRNYKSLIRPKRYMDRIVERAYCVDVNFLASQGFFRSGRGPIWTYTCTTERDGELARIECSLVDGDCQGEHAILLKNIYYFPRQGLPIKIYDMRHPLFRWRHFVLCPRCRRKVMTLFIPWEGDRLACRRCHKLVYWSQMRGRRRIGEEAYERGKELYRVHKSAVRDDGANTEDKRS